MKDIFVVRFLGGVKTNVEEATTLGLESCDMAAGTT